jgi:serine O-acetyltransferase
MSLKNLREEIDATIARDPAARSRWEVVLCYPGFHAVIMHRVAHGLWKRGWFLSGRFVSNVSRWLTGIEIHPEAKIGRRLFIDHGTGVVIGATAEIGDDVTLYQGVTLGGTSLHQGKRHPTLADGVIVGSGAKVLGGFTVGAGARIAANAVVLDEVPPGTTMVGIPAKPVERKPAVRPEDCRFLPYGTPCEEIPDPVARVLNGLLDEVVALRARVAVLEGNEALRLNGNGHAAETREEVRA